MSYAQECQLYVAETKRIKTIWIPDKSRHIFRVFFLSTILGKWKACICVPLKPIHQVVGVVQQPVELVALACMYLHQILLFPLCCQG